MTVPAVVGMQVLGALLEHQTRLGAARLEAETQRHMADLQAAVARERIQAQAQIADALISAARHVFDRKTELLESSFNSVITLINTALQDLKAKEAGASKLVVTAKGKAERLQANEQLSRIAQERAELLFHARKLQSDMLAFLSTLDLDLPPQLLHIGAR